MNAANFFQHLELALSNGTAHIDDPGDAGTIVVNNKGYGICEVVTAGAESRILDPAAGLPVGTELVVILKTDGGDLTIDSDDTDVVLASAGDLAAFKVSISGVTKVWKCTTVSQTSLLARLATIQAATAVGAIDISAYSETAFKSVLTILAAAGIVTDNTTT